MNIEESDKILDQISSFSTSTLDIFDYALDKMIEQYGVEETALAIRERVLEELEARAND